MKAEAFRDLLRLPGREPLEAIGDHGRFQTVGFPEVIPVIGAEGDDRVRIPHHHFLGKVENFVANPLELSPFPVNAVDGDHNFLFAQGREKEKAGIAQGVKVQHIIPSEKSPQGRQEGGHQGVRCLLIDGEDRLHPHTPEVFRGGHAPFSPDVNRHVLPPGRKLLGEPAHHHIDSPLPGGNALGADHCNLHGKSRPISVFPIPVGAAPFPDNAGASSVGRRSPPPHRKARLYCIILPFERQEARSENPSFQTYLLHSHQEKTIIGVSWGLYGQGPFRIGEKP